MFSWIFGLSFVISITIPDATDYSRAVLCCVTVCLEEAVDFPCQVLVALFQ
jgi:hypothetical protein